MSAPTPVVQNLKHWSLHVLLSASGAFVLAYLADWRKPQSVAGMLAGIAVYIALYTSIWSSRWFQRRVVPGSTLARALLYGTRLRSSLGVLAPINFLFAVGGLPLIFALPDLYAGTFAIGLFQSVGRSSLMHSFRVMVAGPDAHQRGQNIWVGDLNSLLPTFAITLLDGFLLTVMLLVFSVLCLLILKCRARWKCAPRSAEPGPSVLA